MSKKHVVYITIGGVILWFLWKYGYFPFNRRHVTGKAAGTVRNSRKDEYPIVSDEDDPRDQDGLV